MDAALRQESIRASRLADELRKTPHMEVPQPMPRRFILPSCSYSGVCTRYKELLMERSTLTGLSPIKIHCYCNICAAGKPLLAVSGSPPHQYTLPVGWCQFILRLECMRCSILLLYPWFLTINEWLPTLWSAQCHLSIVNTAIIVIKPNQMLFKHANNITFQSPFQKLFCSTHVDPRLIRCLSSSVPIGTSLSALFLPVMWPMS